MIIFKFWEKQVFESIGVDINTSIEDFPGIFSRWMCLTMSKLIMAAFFWSLGFFVTSGENCWGRYSSFSKSPKENNCTIYSFVVSGMFAAFSLVTTIKLLDYLIRTREDHRTNDKTLVLLTFSVWISDSFWSIFNWMAFSIALNVAIPNVSAHNDQDYSTYDYLVGGVPAFFLNALLFYIVHNALRCIVIGINDYLLKFGQLDLWHCDILFALVVGGGYYGFGPIAVMLIDVSTAKSIIDISVLNAVGTGIGCCLTIICIYFPPVICWFCRKEPSNVDFDATGVSDSIPYKGSTELPRTLTISSEQRPQSMQSLDPNRRTDLSIDFGDANDSRLLETSS